MEQINANATLAPRSPAAMNMLRRAAIALQRHPIWLFLIGCMVFFSWASPWFFTLDNLSNVLVQSAFVGFLAIGMTLIMINGNIDLSVGSILAFCGCLAVGLQEYGLVVAIGSALLAGIGLGLLNGLVMVKTGVHAFIVTLGALIGIRGLVFVYTQEQSLSATSMAYLDFGMLSLGPLNVIAIVFLLSLVAMQWVLSRTRHGREAYAIGGNHTAAVNAGVKVSRHVVLNFAISGFMAALAGITMTTQMGAATPNLGTNYELWTIIAVVLGGTKLQGGTGNLWGTLAGVLTLGVLRNGLNLLHVQPFYELVILGAVLILALFLDKQFNKV